MILPSWRTRTVLTATLVLSSAVPTTAAGARAERAAPTVQCRTGANDFDGNGGTDLAVSAVHTGGDEDSGIAPAGQVVVEMRTKAGYRSVRINPPSLPAHRIGDFGKSIAELDLSGHTHPAQPCSALAIGADLLDTDYNTDEDVLLSGVVVLYRYDTRSHQFVQLSMIKGTDVDPALTEFGSALASQQMRSDRPRPRQRVLYVAAQSKSRPYDRGAVVRLALTASGDVARRQIIAPGPTATPVMPLSYAAAGANDYLFGTTLQATPSADQVIIGDPGARHGGAVVVWNRSAPAQLLTEPRLGAKPTRASDAFGRSIWLSTEAANASGGHTYLLIGAPWRTVHGKDLAGAAFRLRYDRSTSPDRAVISSNKYWTQATTGVAGAPGFDHQFGSSFQSLTNGKSPKFLVGIPGEKVGTKQYRYGAVDVLGDGRMFTDVNLHHGNSDSQIGDSLGAWRNVNDYLAKDPWPAPGKGKWSRLVVVGDATGNEIYSGLPAGSWHDVRTIQDGVHCSYETGSCEFGGVMTTSGGG